MLFGCKSRSKLASESVKGSALALEGVDDVKCCDCLPPGVLCVGHGIPDDVLKEDLEDAPGLLVDQAGDTLDASTTSQPTDGWLCDALDVIPEDLPVPLGASLSCKSLLVKVAYVKRSRYWCFTSVQEILQDCEQVR